jgi:hypothetical protein
MKLHRNLPQVNFVYHKEMGPLLNPHTPQEWFLLNLAGFQAKTHGAPKNPNLNLINFFFGSPSKALDSEISTALKMASIPLYTGLWGPQFGV